jgi:hypothetical protein
MLLLTACETVDPVPRRFDCTVDEASANTASSAIQELSSVVAFVLPDELGGLVCTPDGTEACAQQLDEQCIAQLDAVVGVPVTTSIGLDSPGQVGSTIEGIALDGDCAAAWQLTEPLPTFVGGDATVQVGLTFVGTSAGTCTARFVVTSNADNFDVNGTASIILTAQVTE